MSDGAKRKPGLRGVRLAILLVPAAGLMMGGCGQFGGLDQAFNPFNKVAEEEPIPDQGPATDLQQATDYWGQQFSKKPGDLKIALNYARNLKALGDKKRALAVLQQAAMFHSSSRELNSEYGRLALDQEQVAVAKKLLEAADDPARPDWRVISARGTVMAKEGRAAEAIGFYERALALSPDQPSVVNNLAMALAMNGQPEKAEEMLKSANVTGPAAAKARQNLALVLGLQGKYEEATKVGSENNGTSMASANTELLRKMVKLEAKPMSPAGAPVTGWNTSIAASTAPSASDWKSKVVRAPAPSAQLRPAAVDTAAAEGPAPKIVGVADPLALRPATQ